MSLAGALNSYCLLNNNYSLSRRDTTSGIMHTGVHQSFTNIDQDDTKPTLCSSSAAVKSSTAAEAFEIFEILEPIILTATEQSRFHPGKCRRIAELCLVNSRFAVVGQYVLYQHIACRDFDSGQKSPWWTSNQKLLSMLEHAEASYCGTRPGDLVRQLSLLEVEPETLIRFVKACPNVQELAWWPTTTGSRDFPDLTSFPSQVRVIEIMCGFPDSITLGGISSMLPLPSDHFTHLRTLRLKMDYDLLLLLSAACGSRVITLDLGNHERLAGPDRTAENWLELFAHFKMLQELNLRGLFGSEILSGVPSWVVTLRLSNPFSDIVGHLPNPDWIVHLRCLCVEDGINPAWHETYRSDRVRRLDEVAKAAGERSLRTGKSVKVRRSGTWRIYLW